MKYKSNLKKHLRTAKIKKKRFLYELSYEKGIDLKKLKTDKILNYINDNYINDKGFKKEGLINDLICLKTYRDYIELELKTEDFFISYSSLYIATFMFMFSRILEEPRPYNLTVVKSGRYIVGKIIQTDKMTFSDCVIGALLIALLASFLVVFFRRAIKAYKSKKLTSLNNAIYILEAIEEDMVKVNGTTYEVNVDNLVGEKSEPRKYFVNVSEILEEKINEGTIESKNKSIEIKINL